jgi:hypothetical protein
MDLKSQVAAAWTQWFETSHAYDQSVPIGQIPADRGVVRLPLTRKIINH